MSAASPRWGVRRIVERDWYAGHADSQPVYGVRAAAFDTEAAAEDRLAALQKQDPTANLTVNRLYANEAQ